MRALYATAFIVGLVTAGAGSARLAAAPPTKPASSIGVTVAGLGCSTPLGADSFEARAWSWGAENVMGDPGSGGGAGKAVISGLSLTRLSDACSPLLLKSVVTGKRHTSVTLTQYDSNGVITTTVLLNDATITYWTVGGASSAAEATEQVRIGFSKFTLTDAASGNKFCYDVAASTPGC